MQLNAFQIAAVKNYNKGEYAHLVAIADGEELQAAFDATGDTVLHDIVLAMGKLDPGAVSKLEAASVLRETIRNAREMEYAPQAAFAAA